MSLGDMSGEGKDTGGKPNRLYPVLVGIAILFLIIITSLFLGCPKQGQYSGYICYDGSVVTDTGLCPPLDEYMECNYSRIINQTTPVVKYVCFNGSIVDNIEDCPPSVECISTTSTSTTSTTTSTTSTTTIKSDINCRRLGCPRGTLYVGSKKTMLFYDCKCYYPRYLILEDEMICFRNITEAYDFRLGNKTMEPAEYCDIES